MWLKVSYNVENKMMTYSHPQQIEDAVFKMVYVKGPTY